MSLSARLALSIARYEAAMDAHCDRESSPGHRSGAAARRHAERWRLPWPPKPTAPVSESRAERVRRLFELGHSDEDIANELGTTVEVVKRTRGNLRLLRARRPAAPVVDGVLRRLHAAGFTHAEIAARTGLTHRTVQEHMHRLGLRAN